MKIAVVGGDLRSLVVGKELGEAGFDCHCFGFDACSEEPEKMVCEKDAELCCQGADALILPLPCLAQDQKHIFAPLSKQRILFESVINRVPRSCVVCGGMLPFEDEYHIDYYSREELKLRNAVPTAEGAIGIAFEEMPVTVWGSKTLVLGFGRIGRCLSSRLKALGSTVFAAMRKDCQRAAAEEMGVQAVEFGELCDIIPQCDAVFNTVPCQVMGDRELSCVSRNCPVIDLASRPGGVDFEQAKQMGVRAVWALSLPGKVAPITAGRIIYKSVRAILDSKGVTV